MPFLKRTHVWRFHSFLVSFCSLIILVSCKCERVWGIKWHKDHVGIFLTSQMAAEIFSKCLIYNFVKPLKIAKSLHCLFSIFSFGEASRNQKSSICQKFQVFISVGKKYSNMFLMPFNAPGTLVRILPSHIFAFSNDFVHVCICPT